MADQFNAARLERAWELLGRWVDEDRFPAIAAAVGSAHGFEQRAYGRLRPDRNAAELSPASIFLIASPTKPVVALAVMSAVDEGLLKLQDPVAAFVPEFASQGKRGITLAHLLTHTSGLPDMLPDNTQLRQKQAPIEAFLQRTCRLKPDFLPGRGLQYQSMGFLMLGEVLRRVTGQPIGEVLRRRIFEPLNMQDTALGMPEAWEVAASGGLSRAERIAEIRTGDTLPFAATWNTSYWRRFGAPWGGLLSTTGDLARLCQHLLSIHAGESSGIISPAALQAMTTNRLDQFVEVPEPNRRCFAWGYGWQLNWPGHATTLGDLLSPQAYGHWGATGTMMWIDPPRDLFSVVLSTEPLENGPRRLANFSNAVCAALA